MHERRSTTPEDKIDDLLARGDIAAAEAFIDEALKQPHITDKDFHHLTLKRVALPLFEIAYGTNDPRAYDEANDAYADIGEILQRKLDQTSCEDLSAIGEVSEQTFLALHLGRLIDEDTPAIILPASRKKDKEGTDFYLSPLGTGKIDDGWPIQLKTVATAEDEDRYGHATLISMIELDPYAKDPLHPDSLASSILRELDGEATDTDLQRLHDARRKTFELMQKKNGTRRAIAKSLFQTVERLFALDGEAAI